MMHVQCSTRELTQSHSYIEGLSLPQAAGASAQVALTEQARPTPRLTSQLCAHLAGLFFPSSLRPSVPAVKAA